MSAARAIFTDSEVTVVGAGPAGLACAIVLARAGRPVVVREMHKTVGARFSGDFQGLENWSDPGDVLEELRTHGIGASFDCHPVFGGTAYDAWGKSYEFRSRRPLYYLVRRGPQQGSLDQGLLEQAAQAGVDVRFGDRVPGTQTPGVISGGPRGARVIAVGYVFHTAMPDGNWICFQNSLAPLGYSYLLVHGGRGTIASCMFTDFKNDDRYLSRTVEFFRNKVGLQMQEPRRFGGYGNFGLPATAVLGGNLVSGEQAGFQDALAGFGIRYAIRTGILAAKSLLEGVDYTALWRTSLLRLLRTSMANRFFINLTGDHGWRWILAHRLSRGDVREAMRKLYEPSVFTRVLYPLARWTLTPFR